MTPASQLRQDQDQLMAAQRTWRPREIPVDDMAAQRRIDQFDLAEHQALGPIAGLLVRISRRVVFSVIASVLARAEDEKWIDAAQAARLARSIRIRFGMEGGPR